MDKRTGTGRDKYNTLAEGETKFRKSRIIDRIKRHKFT